MCEHAFRLTQHLDPTSEGRGVLQFKTGLKSIIKVFVKSSRPLLVMNYISSFHDGYDIYTITKFNVVLSFTLCVLFFPLSTRTKFSEILLVLLSIELAKL